VSPEFPAPAQVREITTLSAWVLLPRTSRANPFIDDAVAAIARRSGVRVSSRADRVPFTTCDIVEVEFGRG
jgi:hypothetical protein